MQVPQNASVAAGYGLIHTMCTKSTPDNLTDWVLNRTPWAILSTGGHKRSRRQTGIISPAPAGSRISLEFKIGAQAVIFSIGRCGSPLHRVSSDLGRT